MEADNDPYVCPRCTREVEKDDDFCPSCGELFAEGVTCEKHPGLKATGVCIVCSTPCCQDCGCLVNDRFFCRQHDTIEIYEDMARVYGNSDAVQVEFAKTTLEDAGLHPFLFSRKASPYSLGAPDYTLFRASGEYDGHIVNEFKVMVPIQEVVPAIDKLRELGFLQKE